MLEKGSYFKPQTSGVLPTGINAKLSKITHKDGTRLTMREAYWYEAAWFYSKLWVKGLISDARGYLFRRRHSLTK
jgi:hypothetical protein